MTETKAEPYRLRSPYHSNDAYSKRVLHSTNTESFKPPIAAHILSAQKKYSQKCAADALKHLSHLPTQYGVNGLPHSTHVCKVYQVLSPRSKAKFQKSNFDSPYDQP